MSKQQRSRLVTAPRLYMNIAILVGGVIGFILQGVLNQDNEGAFIITGACCFIAVAITNFGWLYHIRRQEKRQNSTH